MRIRAWILGCVLALPACAIDTVECADDACASVETSGKADGVGFEWGALVLGRDAAPPLSFTIERAISFSASPTLFDGGPSAFPGGRQFYLSPRFRGGIEGGTTGFAECYFSRAQDGTIERGGPYRLGAPSYLTDYPERYLLLFNVERNADGITNLLCTTRGTRPSYGDVRDALGGDPLLVRFDVDAPMGEEDIAFTEEPEPIE